VASEAGEAPAQAKAAPESVPAAAILMVVILTLFWGINFPIMKLALSAIDPWCFRVVCLVVGSAGLFAIAAANGQRIHAPRGDWPSLVLASLLNITLWHMFSAFGLRLMEAGRAVILAMLFAWVLLGERPRPSRLLGLALGMAGIVVLVGDAALRPDMPSSATLSSATFSSGALAGAVCMLAAAISWGAGTAMLKVRRWGMATTVLTGWQLLIGAGPIVVGSFFFGHVPDPARISLTVWLALAYATTIPMILCHYAWNRLVGLVPAGIAAITTLLIPVVGALSSAPLLGEPIGTRELLALALVVAAVGVVLRGPARRRS